MTIASTVEYSFARTPEELAKVTAFYDEMFPRASRVVEILQWRRSAPDASGGNATFAAWQNGEVVGAVNLIPFAMRAGDTVVQAAWHMDTVVSKAMRGGGIGRELTDRSASQFEVVFAKGTNEWMYRLRKTYGFRDVPNSKYLVRVLSPMRFGTTVAKKAYGVGLMAKSALQRRGQASRGETTVLDRFGSEFDHLAAASRSTPEIRPVKGSAYLNWRYFGCPVRDYSVIGAVSETGLAAAAVVTTRETAWLVDLICDHGDATTLVSLIRASVSRCQANGVASVKAFATSERARQCLRREGFVHTRLTPRFTYRSRDGSALDDAVSRSLDWVFWHGDGDLELYD